MAMESFPLPLQVVITIFVAHLAGLVYVGWTRLPTSESVEQIVDWIHAATRTKNVQALGSLMTKLELRTSAENIPAEGLPRWGQEIEPVYDRIESRRIMRDESDELRRKIARRRLMSILNFAASFLLFVTWVIMQGTLLSGYHTTSFVLFCAFIAGPWILSSWCLVSSGRLRDSLTALRRKSEFQIGESTGE